MNEKQSSQGEARRRGAHAKLLTHLAIGDPVLCLGALSAGASVRARNDEGLSPMQALIYSSAGINKTNLALCASLLLTYGVAPDERDPVTGETVLMEAAQHGSELLSELLLRNNANPHAVVEDPNGDPVDPLNALDFAVCSKRDAIHMESICKMLLFFGVRPDGEDFDGGTVLHRLARYVAEGLPEEGLPQAGTEEIKKTVGLLVKRGANPNAKDHNGNTPLHSLAQSPGARRDPHVMVMALVENGAKLDAQNQNGRTPLHIAVKNKEVGWCQLLLHLGADPSVCDVNGSSPQELVNETGPETLQVVFSQHKAAMERRRIRAAEAAAPEPDSFSGM